MIDQNGEATEYRPCVAILLFRADGRVLIAERNDVSDACWQLPQGGIDKGETPLAAAVRELAEETSVTEARFLQENSDWIPYDLPEELRRGDHWSRIRGQNMKLVAFLFTGADSAINIETAEPEFRAWRWAELEELPGLIVSFKRQLYETAVVEFSPLRDSLRDSLK